MRNHCIDGLKDMVLVPCLAKLRRIVFNVYFYLMFLSAKQETEIFPQILVVANSLAMIQKLKFEAYHASN